MSTSMRFTPGERIFEQGDDSHEAYRILSGSVEISVRHDGRVEPIARLGEGEIFGEMGLVDEKPRSGTATAMEETELRVISEENFHEEVLGNPSELQHYLATLIERLRSINSLFELQRERGEQPPSFEILLRGDSHTGFSIEAVREQKMIGEAPRPRRVLFASAYEPGANCGEDIAFQIPKFPFRIGSDYAGMQTPFMMNDLLLENTKGLWISRNHCSIESRGGGFLIKDRGSVHGTVVNGKLLGTKFGALVAPLEFGENVVVLGGPESPHRYFITIAD